MEHTDHTTTTNGAAHTALPAIGEAVRTATAREPAGSPAQRRVALRHQAKVLRASAATTRQEAAESDDIDEVRRLHREADEYERRASEIDAEVDKMLSRDERRSSRDGLIRRAGRQARRADGSLQFDPRTEEMQALYAERTHPAQVFEQGLKLIRDDGGQYGAAGSVIRAIEEELHHDGLETLSPNQLRAVVRAARWDSMERMHGLAISYCRDAAWILFLFSQVTGEVLDLSKVPIRKPLPDRTVWRTGAFAEEYAKSIGKLGMTEQDDESEQATAGPAEQEQATAEPAMAEESEDDEPVAEETSDDDEDGDEESEDGDESEGDDDEDGDGDEDGESEGDENGDD